MKLNWLKLQNDPRSFVQDLSRTGGDWIRWSPTIRGYTTDPTPGSSTIRGAYTVVHGVCHGFLSITIGAGWAGGTGGYYVEAPVKFADFGYGSYIHAGSGYVYDQGVDDVYPMLVQLRPLTTNLEFIATGTQSPLTGTFPITLSAPDLINFSFTYPIL